MNRFVSTILDRKGLWSKKIMSRLVGYFLLLSLLTVALVTGTAYTLTRAQLKKAVFAKLEGALSGKAEQISHWVNNQRREILFIANSPLVKERARELLGPRIDSSATRRAYSALSGFFKTLVINKQDLREIFLLSHQRGLVVLSTNRSVEGQYRVNDNYFVFGRHSTYTQKVHPSPTDLEPVMTVATPLVGKEGRILGVVAADLDLERMDQIILGRTGLGRTGEAYLVDRHNVFVSSSRFGKDEFPRGVHSPGINAAIQGRSGKGGYENHRGEKVIGVFRWLEGLDMALLVEIQQREALGPAFRLAWTIGLVGAWSALLLTMGVYLLARQIARPILAVSGAASQVAAGDLTARAPVLTTDEVGTLARSFNQMAARLDKAYRGMADKVTQLETTEAALRKSEQYYRDFFENDLTGDFTADAEGTILSHNPAFARILGIESGVPGETRSLADFLPGEDSFDSFLRVLKRDRRLDYHQMVMQREDGRAVNVVANFITLADDKGRLREIKGYLFDETLRLELEDQLRHSQKMEALGRLAGGVAHDFNNLMTAVTGYSDLALAKLEPGDPLRSGIEQIAKAGERAASLTRQLLVFSRRQVLQPKVIDLNRIVIETERMIRRLVGENIEIITNLDPRLGQVLADDGQIQQVIMNLVINARDSMPQGGLLTIETKNNRSGKVPDQGGEPGEATEYVRMSVSDTGAGMPPEVVSRIFDPFFTTKEPGKGTGLGLATVHGVIEESGGRILVDSEPDCGTAFHVILPRTEGRTQDLETEPPTPPVSAKKELILLVEDEAAVRILTKEILEMGGYRVLAAENGQEALVLARQEGEAVRLVLSDVVMPGLSGPEMVLELRRERPSLPVLFISGYTDQDPWSGSLKKEGTAFLAKPFKPAELMLTIKRLLDGEARTGPGD